MFSHQLVSDHFRIFVHIQQLVKIIETDNTTSYYEPICSLLLFCLFPQSLGTSTHDEQIFTKLFNRQKLNIFSSR